MEIEDITIQEYFSQDKESIYDMFVDTLKPENKFAGKVCWMNKLTFDEVEVIKHTFQKTTSLEEIMELFVHIYRIKGDMKRSSKEIFLSTSVFDLFKAKRFIQEWIVKIVEKEKDWLSSPNDNDDRLLMINASERIKPFSHLLTKIKIAKMFGVTPSEIGSWKYSQVFTILAGTKVHQDLIDEFNAIK